MGCREGGGDGEHVPCTCFSVIMVVATERWWWRTSDGGGDRAMVVANELAVLARSPKGH